MRREKTFEQEDAEATEKGAGNSVNSAPSCSNNGRCPEPLAKPLGAISPAFNHTPIHAFRPPAWPVVSSLKTGTICRRTITGAVSPWTGRAGAVGTNSEPRCIPKMRRPAPPDGIGTSLRNRCKTALDLPMPSLHANPATRKPITILILPTTIIHTNSRRG